MQKCAELCKVSLSNNDIGNPCCRRRETKPMGCLEGIFTAAFIWLTYHYKAYDVMKAK